MKAAAPYIVAGVALAAVVAVVAYSYRANQQQPVPIPRSRSAKPRRAKKNPHIAVVVDDKVNAKPTVAPGFGLALAPTGAIEATDFAAWFEHAPQAFEEVLAAGIAKSPEDVMLAVLRRALPRAKWPPAEDSPHRDQYLAMIATVAKHLGMPTEPVPTRRHLSVVE